MSSLILCHHFPLDYGNPSSGCVLSYPIIFCSLKGLKRYMCPCNLHAQTQSFTVLIRPWCPRRSTAQGKSLRTRQVLAASLQYPGSKSQHSANIPKHPIRVTDGCFHLLQMGNFHAFICLSLFWLMFGSDSAGSDASPNGPSSSLPVPRAPHLLCDCSSAGREGAFSSVARNNKAGDLSIWELVFCWSLLSSLVVQSLLSSSHSSFSSVSSLTRAHLL